MSTILADFYELTQVYIYNLVNILFSHKSAPLYAHGNEFRAQPISVSNKDETSANPLIHNIWIIGTLKVTTASYSDRESRNIL